MGEDGRHSTGETITLLTEGADQRKQLFMSVSFREKKL
jgi:hypothetical protein